MSTFLKLKENERQIRKQLITQAVKSLFKEKTFHKMTMRDIAKEAGVSVASIYRYFPSRDDLVVETLTQNIEEIEIQFKQLLSKGESIEDIAATGVSYMLEHEETFQMMSHLMIQGEVAPETLSKYNDVQRRFLELFDQMLVREGVKKEVRLYSHTFFASLMGIVMTYRNYPARSIDEIKKHACRLARLVAIKFKTESDR